MFNATMVTVPAGIKVYDAGPNYADRFTAIYNDGSTFVLSSDTAICNFAGMAKTIRRNSFGVLVKKVPQPVAERLKQLEV